MPFVQGGCPTSLPASTRCAAAESTTAERCRGTSSRPSLLLSTPGVPMAVLSTLIAFSVAKKAAVLTAAYAYGLPRVYRVVLRASRVHVAQPSARALIARSTSRTLRTLRLPAKAVAAVRARLGGQRPAGAAAGADATAAVSQRLPRGRAEGAVGDKASAAVRSIECGRGGGGSEGRCAGGEYARSGVPALWRPLSAGGRLPLACRRRVSVGE